MNSIITSITIFMVLLCAQLHAADAIELESRFDFEEVKWIQTQGDSSISGTAILQLTENKQKGCASFNVELLPVAKYSSERIFKTYGNNSQGQVLLKDNPPKFTPDHPQYHELVRKSQCDGENHFLFKNIPAGEYYVMVFVIWKNEAGQNEGGALMKRVSLGVDEDKSIEI